MDHFIQGVRLLSQLCGAVAAALTAAAVVVVCQMVFVRYVLNETTIWQTDFVTFSLVAATFIGAPYVLLTKGHVNVDLLPLYLGLRARWWLALVAIAISLGFVLVLTVQYLVDLINLLTGREPPFGMAPDVHTPSPQDAGI